MDVMAPEGMAEKMAIKCHILMAPRFAGHQDLHSPTDNLFKHKRLSLYPNDSQRWEGR